MQLYVLSNNYKNILDLLDNEEIEKEVLNKALEEIDEDIQDKVYNITKAIKNIENNMKACKEEEKRIAARRKQLENRVESLKEYVKSCMTIANKKKIETDLFNIKIAKNPPSVKILDENILPAEFKKEVITFSIDKAALKERLKNGESIDGCKLEQGERLDIK